MRCGLHGLPGCTSPLCTNHWDSIPVVTLRWIPHLATVHKHEVLIYGRKVGACVAVYTPTGEGGALRLADFDRARIALTLDEDAIRRFPRLDHLPRHYAGLKAMQDDMAHEWKEAGYRWD